MKFTAKSQTGEYNRAERLTTKLRRWNYGGAHACGSKAKSPTTL